MKKQIDWKHLGIVVLVLCVIGSGFGLAKIISFSDVYWLDSLLWCVLITIGLLLIPIFALVFYTISCAIKDVINFVYHKKEDPNKVDKTQF